MTKKINMCSDNAIPDNSVFILWQFFSKENLDVFAEEIRATLLMKMYIDLYWQLTIFNAIVAD